MILKLTEKVAIDLKRLALAISLFDFSTTPSIKWWFAKLSTLITARQFSDERVNTQFLEAIYDYETTDTTMSTGDKDLSFKKGDLFKLVGPCPRDWLKVELDGSVGVIPADYVKVVASPPEKTGSQLP
jgi:hypothetical protein